MAELLYREFCNHVYLGQWELARACGISLMKCDSFNKNEDINCLFISTLQNIAKNPYLARISWTTAPSPSYISFWACQLLLDLEHGDKCSNLRTLANFNIILETNIKSPKQIIREISSAYHQPILENEIPNISASSHSIKLSDKCLSSLRNAFKENPIAASNLLNMLCMNKSPQISSNLNAVIWDIYYQSIINTLKTLKASTEKSKNLPSTIKLSLKIYLLLCLLPEVETFGDRLKHTKEILADVLELCELNFLSRLKIYQSLLSRPSSSLCKYYFDIEDSTNLTKPGIIKSVPAYYFTLGIFSHRNAFLRSTVHTTHFLKDLMEFCVNSILDGEWSECQNVLKDPVLRKLNSLPLILSWGQCHDNDSILNVIHAMKMWNEPNSSDSLALVFNQFKLNIAFSELCQTFYQDLHPNSSQDELKNKTRSILSNLQMQSPLRVIHSIFGLKNLPSEKVLQLLNFHSGEIMTPSKSSIYLTDKTIYFAYLSMVCIMEAIHLSCVYRDLLFKRKNITSNIPMEYDCAESDKICNKDDCSTKSLEEHLNNHSTHCAYSRFIKNKLCSARKLIKTVFPVAFRVEILENIFSLLFITSNSLTDSLEYCSDSDQGHEGDNSISLPQCDPVMSSMQDTSQSSENEQRIAGRFIISTVKLKDNLEAGKEFRSGYFSCKSSESNSSSGLQPHAFLCNEIITNDLLSLLKDSLIEANAEAYKVIGQTEVPVRNKDSVEISNSEKMAPVVNLNSNMSTNNSTLPERISRLLQFINEAIWRYEVVKSGIFHENSGMYLLQKKKHLFQSQMSASSSDGTDRESRKHKKKRKHKRSFTNHKKEYLAESSIIQCMLSSPDALLRYSLWSKNLKQAEQVIQLFHLEDSNEAKEVVLTQELQRITKKLVENEKIKRKSIISKRPILENDAKSIIFNLQAIEDAAAVGLQSSEMGLIIHQELSTLRIPEIIDITDGIRHPELMLGSENIYSVFLADLAYNSASSLDLSSILFDMACRSWSNSKESIQELDAKVLSRKKMPLIRGNFKTLGMMNAVLKEFLSLISKEDGNAELKQLFWPLEKSYCSFSLILSNFIGSLDCKTFKSEIINWNQASIVLHDFTVLLKDEEVQEKSGSSQKDIVRENRLHMTYKKLSKCLRELRNWSSETIRPHPIKYDNYLSKLLIHLHQVTSAVLDCKKQSSNTDSIIYTSDFSILNESPVELLKKIILQSGVTPEKIEKFAIRMKVDLVHVLAQACLPKVPLLFKNASSNLFMRPYCSSNSNGYPLLILNKKKDEWPSPDHPDFVAKKLLQDLIFMLQDTAMANDSCGIFTLMELISVTEHSKMAKWMEDCTELAFVDLNLLLSKEEKLAFFVNVTNIAWLHAILIEVISWESQEKDTEISTNYSGSDYLNITNSSYLQLLSPNLIERLTTQKILGYCIGQIGPVSLFDMRYQLLHAQLPVPKHLENPPFFHLLGDPKSEWEKYMPPLETRLLFVLIEGMMYSPKLQVLHSEHIDDQLDEAMKDYFDVFIRVDLENEVIYLPKLLEWYALDFSRDDESDLDKASYEGLLNLLSTLVRPNLAELFQTMFSRDYLHNFSENIDASGKNQLPFSLVFEAPLQSLGIKLQYINNQPLLSSEPVPKDTLILETQPFVVNYLKEKCPILNDLYEIFRNEYSQKDLLKINLCLESQAQNLFSSEEFYIKTPVTYLLTFYLNMLLSNVDSHSWFSSALSPVPEREFISQQISSCFEANEWHRALLYVDLYLESFEKDWSYLLLRQIILEHIACDNLPYTVSDPCHYALSINDSTYRAHTVLQNVQKWTDLCTIQALKYCLSDSVLTQSPEVQKSLKTKLKEVQLYKKIFDASEMFGDSDAKDCVYVFNNWQEVADCSVWDQSRILDFIKSCGKYELAVHWAELHIINKEQKMLALSMNIIWFLTQLPPQQQPVFGIIDSFEDPADCELLCNVVLTELPTIEAKLCIVQYLVDNNFSPEKQYNYFNMLLGLKMLSALKSSTRELYIDLIGHPYLLLEQMLMNVELRDAEEALNAIYEDLKNQTDIAPVMQLNSVNQLVEDYASKALEVHFLDALLDISSSSTLVLSTEDTLATDEPFIMPLRVPSKEEWIPDGKIQRCQVCKEEHFNMFSRRHHCRRCGRVVCANCSQHALIVEGYGNIKVRVCDDCYNIMTGSLSLSTASFEKRYRKLSTMVSSSPRSFENTGLRRRAGSVHSQQTFRWMLSTDSEQNASVRNEFSYEQTPSISLCYSILKLHTDDKKCAQFMMNLCDRLLGKIKVRRSGKLPLEVDYSLIISMMKSLLMNVKVKCHQVQDSDGEALANLYFQHLDIIKLLVNANCRHLIPREALTNSDTARKLRDKLLEEERMNLALEVSTKFNLDKLGLWSSWGLFCLKAGDWPTARTKFQQCLKAVKDKNDQSKENPLLSKILKVLENSKYPGNEKAAAIFKSLGSLKNIRNGLTQFETEIFPLDDSIKEESLFYLNTYGTHFATVGFYRRHGLIHEALEYITRNKCVADIFIEALFMPVLKNVQLSILKQLLTMTDPSLTIWSPYLFATCRHLEKLKYMNVLYEVQLFMEDYARAAKSAINFYLAPAASYQTLFERHRYLYNAKKYYEKYLSNLRQSDSVSEVWRRRKNIKILHEKEAESYIQVITFQEEVTNFFELCGSRSHGFLHIVDTSIQNKSLCPPTLFGNVEMKSEVTTMVLINSINIDDGFELAAKLIKTFKLNALSILCKSGRELIKFRQKLQVPHFLASVKCFFAKDVKVDEVILECVSAIHKQGGDVEDIIRMLNADSNKINGYLMCRKLKSAYLLAIKLNSALDVRRIMVAAEQCGQDSIQRICKMWLETNALKLKPKESATLK